MRKVLIGALAIAMTAAAYADDVPMVRDFEPAETEATGTHMFQQDQFAWKATDILLAKHPPKELVDGKMHGWIVVEGETRNLVRFIHESANGPEAFYDVTFGPHGETELSEPPTRVLTPEELAQYRARELALKNFDFRCTSTPPNSVAFKDEKSGNWRVWVMTATTDPNLTILGGHIRFTISADGKTVLTKEKLSLGCGLFNKTDKQGRAPVSQYFRDIVSLKPLESHIFANYAYRIPLFIGTTDGVVWKIDQGIIKTVDLDAPGGDGFTARAAAGSNEECSLVVKRTENGKAKYHVEGDIRVIEATEGDKKFAPHGPSDGEISSIACRREDIVPAPNDYKVLAAGYPLYISDNGRGHPKRMIILGVANGKLQVEYPDGALSADVEVRMQKRLDALQTAFEKAAIK